MEEMLNIVQSITAGDNSSGQLSQLFAQLGEHQCFRAARTQPQLDTVIAHISNLLNDVATKHTALQLLHHFLPQAPIEALELKGAHWTTQTIKVSVQRTNSSPTTSRLAVCVLQQLLQRSATDCPDLAKAMSQTLLPKMMEALPQLPAGSQLAALQLLQTALRLYPGAACIGRAGAIEKWVGGFADATEAPLVQAAARCLHLLQQTRGGGTAGSQHKLTWSAYQLALLAQLHQLLDALYANTAEVMDAFVATGDERLALPELVLSDEPVPRTAQLVTRFVNLCEFLRVALVAPYPVPKAVQPARILSLISRGLAVNCATLAANLIIDNICVGALIPRIHGALFTVLGGLIAVLRTNLLPHGHNIMQLLMQSLHWTSSGRAAGRPRPFRSLRIAAYRTLLLWTRVAGAASGAERHDELIEQIVQDVTPYATEVRLKVLTGARKHMSKKARKQLHRAQNDATNLAQSHGGVFDAGNSRQVLSDAGNEPLAEAALMALGGVLSVCGQFLKPVVQRLLHEHIVRLALTVRLQAAATGSLYANANCRRALYAALEALQLGSHHLVPAPLQYARVVFAQAAQRDGSGEVREECARAGRLLERQLHPQKETMRFAVDAALQRDALQALKQLGGRRAAGEVDSDAEVEEEEEDNESEKAEAPQLEEDAAEEADAEEVEEEAVDEEVADEVAAEEAEAAEEEDAEAEEDEEDSLPLPQQSNGDDIDNIAPRQREKRSASPAASAAASAPAEKKPKVLSVAAMAENAAAEAMVDDMMAEFVGEFVESGRL